MKALELCKEALRILRLDKGDEYRYNVGILLKEAIAELEELQNRSCESCTFYNNGNCHRIEDYICPNYEIHDDSGFYIKSYEVEKDFYCNKYELKDK